jgi:hypothetical protein
MKIPNHKNEIGVFVPLEETCPILVIYPECVKAQ